MEKHRVISFDLDGTLVDTNFDDLLWGQEIPRLYALEKKISLKKAREHCFKEFDREGEDSLNWYSIHHWLKHFEISVSHEKIVNDLKHHIKTYPDALPALKSLKQKGFELIVVSNATRFFVETKIEVDELRKYFTHIFSATTDFKQVKGCGNTFECVCEKLGITPQELTHVGDHLQFDYTLAKKAGINAFYLDRSGKTKGKNVVRDLMEFEAKIKK